MIAVNALISLFNTMFTEHWSYIWGHAEKGCVDCSGAFVYAYKVLGRISIAHGSNAIARKWVVSGMLPISMAQPGMVAFKARQPGEDGYDLPERYRQGGAGYSGDLTDYYHIGLVDEDTHFVLNAKGAIQGFCRDKLTSGSGWDFVAYLKDVDYGSEPEEETRMKAKVVPTSTSKGNTVNMRSGDSTDSPIILRVPFGSAIDVLADQGTWCKVEFEGKTGYMQSNYIEYEGMPDDSISDEDRQKIDDALKRIEEAVDIIGGILGRG